MKRYYYLWVVLLVGFVLSACDDNEEEPDYYVRYTVVADPGKEVDISCVNESGDYWRILTKAADGKYQYTVGPVCRGFKAVVSANYAGGGATESLAIEESREAAPFVLKVHGSHYSSLYWIVGEKD